MQIQLRPNEVVLKAGNTKHYFDDYQIKGKLILTNQRLFFKSLEENPINGDEIELFPGEILEVLVFNTFGFIPNGLNVVTKEGKHLKFNIKKRDSWCEGINKMC